MEHLIRYGLVVRITRFHRVGRGSIPRWRIYSASVAQLAARGSHNPKVVGSKPTGGILIASAMLLWRSWQRIGLMSRWSRVRAPAGAAFALVMAGWPSGLRRWF